MTESRWTYEGEMLIAPGGSSFQCAKPKLVCDLINASIAAEREKYDALERTYREVRDELKSQLAAERLMREDAHICDLCGGVIKRGKHFCVSCAATTQEQLAAERDALELANTRWIDCQQQLTAERKKLQNVHAASERAENEAAQLREQPAAAVEALKGIKLVIRGGIRYPEIFIKDVEKICADALAKLGAGK